MQQYTYAMSHDQVMAEEEPSTLLITGISAQLIVWVTSVLPHQLMMIYASTRDACSTFAQVQAMHPNHASQTEADAT